MKKNALIPTNAFTTDEALIAKRYAGNFVFISGQIPQKPLYQERDYSR